LDTFRAYGDSPCIAFGGSIPKLHPIILETAVGSQKSAQALDAPGKIKKCLITTKVTTTFFISPCTPISYTAVLPPTAVSRIITAILISCIFPVLFSHHALAQSIGFDRQIGERQTAQDHLILGIDFYLTDELDSAIQEFRQAQQLWPEYANAHWNLGVGLAKLGDLEGAVTAWAQAKRIDPSAVPVRHNVSALVTYNYGIGLLEQGDLCQAIMEWEQALHIQPDLAEVHYTLGQAYQIKGNTGRGQSKSIDRETMKEQEDRMKTQVPDDELEKEERSKS